MKTGIKSQVSGESPLRNERAFTLIELLVVIAIIAILAGLTLTVTAGVSRLKMKTAAKAGLAQIEADIERYKAKRGVYPPADTNNPAFNALYYELGGTTLDEKTGKYTTLDGSAQIAASIVSATFGPGVGGFVNCTRGEGGDEGSRAENLLKGLKSSQFMELTNPSNPATTIMVLGAPLDGPIVYNNPGTGSKINPWRYNCVSPTNNPKTYDLWIDFLVGGKTNRVSNWNPKGEVL